MKTYLSDRINKIETSKSIHLAALVDKLKREGREIISLNVGEPDFSPPTPIVQATQEALDKGFTRYSLVPGIPELREEIAKKCAYQNNLDVEEKHICISNGSKQVLYNIFQMVLNDGDEVLVPIPYWVTFPESIKLAGGVPVMVPSKPNHLLDFDQLEKAATNKTKAVIINSPNNPSGVVYPKEDLIKLAEFAKKNEILIISDEAYEFLTYFNHDHVSIASLNDDCFKRTLTVQTFSKSYCMTGFRIGYLVAHEDYVKAFSKLQSHLTGNNCTFAQYGALESLKMNQGVFVQMKEEFSKRALMAYELFSEIFDCTPPQGAFYLFPNIEKYISTFKSDEQFCKFILEKANVALLPGSAFGLKNHIRISFATSKENIQKAYEQIKAVL